MAEKAVNHNNADETSKDNIDVETTETGVPSTSSSEEDVVEAEIMKGATLSLAMGAFVPCIPVAIVSSVLLTLIFHNEIKAPFTVVQQISTSHSTGFVNTTRTDLQALENGGKAVYWVWATTATTPGTLHTIASITGKIMPFLTSTSMALVAFFAGRRVVQASKKLKYKSIPTPHQMSILISLLNGSGVSPIWQTLKYRMQAHETLVQPVHLAFWSLLWIVAITLAIQGVDSWFGVAVQPVTVDLLRISNTTSSFGRGLDPTICDSLTHDLPCIGDSSKNCTYPCSITTWSSSSHTQRFGLQHAQEGAEVLMNNSLSDFVANVSTGNYYDYNAQHFFLGDIQSNATLDFSALVNSVQTQCHVITQDCDVGEGFTCGSFSAPSFAWSGAVGLNPPVGAGLNNESNVGIQFFNSSNHSDAVGRNGSTNLFAMQNPIPFLVWSKGFPPVDTSSDQFAYMRDNHYIGSDASGDPVFILDCEMSIYHGRYNWTNGVIPTGGLYDLALAEPEYGALYSAAFAMDTALGHLSLQDAAALAAYQDKPETLATRFNDVLVTMVPKAPLWTLIALKAVYALFALVLAVLAVALAEPLTTQDIKERLTINGLAAGLFEAESHLKTGVKEMEELFDEHKHQATRTVQKVGIVQNERGGWTWASTMQLANNLGLNPLKIERLEN
ncbi:uncharacterized protein AB675_3577 [Cyphellophora attinorum]|uniref:Uncharacterized protein n=1 Tax=Cyphellophora attinorum TaxID=1664694 RepID=A0A0N1NYQ6_9EURO|nr:uncharacterized protein AB675_3577 [Phialophora attinorum]KPI39580.1 hypothetical protein AB675_3577 [Phialophora attinorum]